MAYVTLAIAYLIVWFLAGALFEPRDIWVGVFWYVKTEWETVYSATNYDMEKPSHYGTDGLQIYICCIPMFPIKLEFRKGE